VIESLDVSFFFIENASKGVNDYTKYLAADAPVKLVDWVQAFAGMTANIRSGYRDGVLLVRTPNIGNILHDTAVIEEDDELIATFRRRLPEEDPRKNLSVVKAKLPLAESIFFVIYRADVLEEGHERSRPTEWEVIAALTSSTDEPEPMHPDTLIANHYLLSGGTSTNLKPEKFESVLRESVLFWKNRAKVVIQ
jgi:hypothetical protein